MSESWNLPLLLRSRKGKFAVASMIILAAWGTYEAFQPHSYETCIEKHLKGVNSEVAARAMIFMCRREFPQKPVELDVKDPFRQSQTESNGRYLGEKLPGPPSYGTFYDPKTVVFDPPEQNNTKTSQDDSKAKYFSQLTALVPDWTSILNDPAFLQFLNASDPETGKRRYDDAYRADKANDAQRVAYYYNSFKEYRKGQTK